MSTAFLAVILQINARMIYSFLEAKGDQNELFIWKKLVEF